MKIKAEGNMYVWISPPLYGGEYTATVVTYDARPYSLDDSAWLEKTVPFEFDMDIDPKEAVGKQLAALETQLEEKRSEYHIEKKMLEDRIASLLCLEADPE